MDSGIDYDLFLRQIVQVVDDFLDVFGGTVSILFVAGDYNNVLLRIVCNPTKILRFLKRTKYFHYTFFGEVDLNVVIFSDFGDDGATLANNLGMILGIDLNSQGK